MRAAVLTVSDGVAAGVREDRSGDILAVLLAEEGYDVERRVVADELEEIEDAIAALSARATLVLTTGGTGLAPRDVTPDATEIDDRPPGARDRRRRSAPTRSRRRRTGCSRAGSQGSAGTTLIVNLPGSPGGCSDGFAVLRPALRHALELIADEPTEHRQT